MSLITLTLNQGFNTWWNSSEFKGKKKKELCVVRYSEKIIDALSRKNLMNDELQEVTGLNKHQISKGVQYLNRHGKLESTRKSNGQNTYFKVWSLKK